MGIICVCPIFPGIVREFIMGIIMGIIEVKTYPFGPLCHNYVIIMAYYAIFGTFSSGMAQLCHLWCLLVPHQRANTRVSRFVFFMDLWWMSGAILGHVGCRGLPNGIIFVPSAGRICLPGSLWGRLAFILQPCGVQKNTTIMIVGFFMEIRFHFGTFCPKIDWP